MMAFRSAPIVLALALGATGATGCTLDSSGLEPEGSSSGTGAGATTGGGGAGGSGTGATGTGAGATGGSGGAATGGAGGTGGVGECGVGLVCAPTKTAGSYILRGPEGASACPAGWEALGVYGDGTDPGCDPCPNCTLAGSCDGSTITVEIWEGSNCNQDTASYALADGECLDILTAATSDLVTAASGYRVNPALPATIGGCQPVASTPSPLVSGLSGCLLTAGGEGAACDGGDGVCLPAGNAELTDVCVLVAAGDPCPSGYPDERMASLVTNDTRVCSCTCGAEDAMCVGAEVTGHPDSSCAVAAIATQAADGMCQATAGLGTIFGVLAETGTYAGSCPGIDAPTGSVEFATVQKLCCDNT